MSPLCVTSCAVPRAMPQARGLGSTKAPELGADQRPTATTGNGKQVQKLIPFDCWTSSKVSQFSSIGYGIVWYSIV